MKSDLRSILCCVVCFVVLCLIAPFPSIGQGAVGGKDAEGDGEVDISKVFPDLYKQNEQLKLQNSIAQEQLKKKLAELTAAKQELELQNSITQQKLQAKIAALQAEIEELSKQIDVVAKRATLREAERRSKLDAELAESRDKLEKAKIANDLAAAELTVKTRDLAQKEQDLRVRTMELQNQRLDFENQVAKINSEINLREKREEWRNRVNREIQYAKDPFKGGVLTISDRRIALNGVVTMDMADYIAERIDYFNNQNTEFPIFIVIDRSPGGSVMAGYKILKAMDGSPAPVYVVVKSFAASMAAGITTLSKKSYAYPNAIIMHHQILSGTYGNLTQQREQIKEIEEWWKRLATPIAAKMGLTTDEFIKRMYQNRSTGDWQEFADSARKLKWVDEIVETIREESYVSNPDYTAAGGDAEPRRRNGARPVLQEETDKDGRRFVILPRLDPVDCYYLYNPDNYYRLSR